MRQRVDGSGQVVSVDSYRPFGSPLVGDGGDPYGYTGEWSIVPEAKRSGREGETGLLFLRARYLQPGTGRFLSLDPWQGNTWQPGTLHRYVYVLNNPLKYTDPTGHRECGAYCEGDSYDPVLDNFYYVLPIPAPDPWSDPNYSDWYSGRYGGCFMCHAGGGRTPLTNEELAAAEGRMQVAAFQGGTAMVLGTTIAVGGWGLVSWLSSDGDPLNEIRSITQSYLEALPEPCTSVNVPSGQINSRIMAMLQRVTGDEFALVRANGERLLVRGYSSGAWLPPETTRLVAHTHPITHPKASGFDRQALKVLEQAWSLIVMEDGSIIKFFSRGN